MSSMRQDGERVVSLHPIFTLKRVVSAQETGDMSALCDEIQSFAAQHGAQPDGPIANLAAHLANPPANCFTTNGVSIPSLADLPKAVSPSAY